jgi:hypothetical protein
MRFRSLWHSSDVANVFSTVIFSSPGTIFRRTIINNHIGLLSAAPAALDPTWCKAFTPLVVSPCSVSARTTLGHSSTRLNSNQCASRSCSRLSHVYPLMCLIERGCRDGSRSGGLVNCGRRLACLAWPLFWLAELRPGVEVIPMTGTLRSKFVAGGGVFPRRGSSVSQTSPGRGGHQRSHPASGLRSWGGNPATEIPPGAPLGPCASLHSFLE